MSNGISELALDALADLRAEGLSPTDTDIIRLNAVALAISDSGETNAFTVPKFVVVGGCTLWEPTLAAYDWFSYARTLADDISVEDWMFAFACAHGRDRIYLSALTGKVEIEVALGTFISSLAATRDEVFRAVDYLVSDGVLPDPTQISRDSKFTDPDEEVQVREALEKFLAEAVATLPGISFGEIMEQTPRRLGRMIYASHVLAGLPVTRKSSAAYASYLATLGGIKKRLQDEKKEV